MGTYKESNRIEAKKEKVRKAESYLKKAKQDLKVEIEDFKREYVTKHQIESKLDKYPKAHVYVTLALLSFFLLSRIAESVVFFITIDIENLLSDPEMSAL